MSKPLVYLLCGLPGSGKTTYANHPVASMNVTKLSIDETMLGLYGVLGKDYPEDKYRDHKAVVMAEIKQQIVDKLFANQSLVLDFGVWKKKDREYFNNFIEANGGVCKLIYLKANKDILVRRLKNRHKIEEGKALNITESMLDVRIEKFEETKDEKEVTIRQV